MRLTQRQRRLLRDKSGDALFMIPGIALFTVFFVVPASSAFYYAFTDWNGVSRTVKFVGFQNYIEMFKDPDIFATIPITIKYVLFNIALLLVFSLLLSLCLNMDKIKIVHVVRVIYFMPMLVGGICIGFIFKQIFAPVINMDSGNMGSLNAILVAIGLPDLTRAWTGDPNTALSAVLVTSLWQSLGFYSIIFLSRLQSIPKGLYEASAIDGAGAFSRFRYVTLPMLAPAITINLTLVLISSLRVFDVILALTDGGPGTATQVINLAIYKQSFEAQRVGLGCAMSVVLSVVVCILTVGTNILLRRKERLN